MKSLTTSPKKDYATVEFIFNNRRVYRILIIYDKVFKIELLNMVEEYSYESEESETIRRY